MTSSPIIRLPGWLLLIAVWPAMGILLNLLPATGRAAAGRPVFDAGLFVTMVRWGSWALLVPLIYRLVDRPLVVRAVAAVVVSAGHSLIVMLAVRATLGDDWSHLLAATIRRFPVDFPHDLLIYTSTLMACWLARRTSLERAADLQQRSRNAQVAAAAAAAARTKPEAVAEQLSRLRALAGTSRDAAEDFLEVMTTGLRNMLAAFPVIEDGAETPNRERLHPTLPTFIAGAAVLLTGVFAAVATGAGTLVVLVFVTMTTCAAIVIAGRRSHARRVSALEAERRLAVAELEALRQQLNPHFLFNALTSVAALLRRSGAEAAVMIERLQTFFELSCRQAVADRVPLADELRFVDAYLAVERVRFGERLRVDVTAAGDMSALLVPPLVLQPLVENAVRHGIARKPEGGAIVIHMKREGSRLFVVVENDALDTPSRAEGIGLRNTRARIRQFYGPEARLESGRNGHRYRATLTFPAEAACAS